MITITQIEAAQRIRSKMFGWLLADEVICAAIKRAPLNTDAFEFLIKVQLVNKLYWTHIKEDDEHRLAHDIAQIGTKLDRLLSNGDAKAVQAIAECGARRNQVFASKYAHFHNPSAFALGDKYVNVALQALGGKIWDREGHRYDIAEEYARFQTQISDMAQECKVGLKQMDEYLWLRGQKETILVASTKLGTEVNCSMKHYPDLWKQL